MCKCDTQQETTADVLDTSVQPVQCGTCGGIDHGLLHCTRPGGASGPAAEPRDGSAGHATDACEPCAWYHSSEGCRYGLSCKFCHLCPPGEMKRRKKAKRELRKQEFEAEEKRKAELLAAEPAKPPAVVAIKLAEELSVKKKRGRKAKPVATAALPPHVLPAFFQHFALARGYARMASWDN
jgi:hypothetical protein